MNSRLPGSPDSGTLDAITTARLRESVSQDSCRDLAWHIILIVAHPRRKRDPDASAEEPPVSGKIVELGILLGQIKNDGRRFRDNAVAIDEHRQLAGGIERKEFRALVLPGQQVDGHELEVRAEFPEAPEGAKRTRRTES